MVFIERKFVIWVFYAFYMKPLFLFCLFLSTYLGAAQDLYPTVNELSREQSPYLLQHANNPVAWKTWSSKAFEKAKELDRLVVISVGYASCHWCHVMEEESFEDLTVARFMNENYINIKVDREERPDVDQSYMTALRLMGADGGWPLNVIALPNGKPVYAGTYHSKVQWIELLQKMQTLYESQPLQLRNFAEDLQKGIVEENKLLDFKKDSPVDPSVLEQGLGVWKKNWDVKDGGNTGAQKFIRPNGLMFLLDYAQLSGDQQAMAHVWNSLDKISESGIYDQLSGGFFRYSTDPEWRVPHFEKMLYDNAQIIALFAKAYKISKKEKYAAILSQTIQFLMQEFKRESGGFMAAMDADLKGEEGAYYRWTEQELQSLIGSEWSLFAAVFKLDSQQLWEEQYYVLQKASNLQQIAREFGLSVEEVHKKQKKWQKLLLAAQEKRGNPAMDDKIITSWNAMLVSALTSAYQATATDQYLQEAIALQDLLTQNGVGAISHVLGTPDVVFSEDYAFLAKSALDLYVTTGAPTYLSQANALMEALDTLFYAPELGLYYFSEADDILTAVTRMSDGVMPSDNSVAAEVNFLLGHIKYEPERTKKAMDALMASSAYLKKDLNNYTQWASLWLTQSYPYYELAIIGDQALEKSLEFLSKGVPNVLLTASVSDSDLPLFEFRYSENETLLYVCENYSCKAPVKTVSEALNQIQAKTVIKPF